MRTTIDIDDQLLLYAKQSAVKHGCSLKNILEDALRVFLSRSVVCDDLIKLETFSGTGLKPGVDLTDNQSLNDIMHSL